MFFMERKENLGRGGTEGYPCGNKWTKAWREKGLKGNLGEQGSVMHPCGVKGKHPCGGKGEFVGGRE